MLPDKINMTNSLRYLIKTKRNERKITGTELSKIIGQKSSYISAVENGRIKSLSLSNLKNIIIFLYECDDIQAKSIIKESLQNTNNINSVLKDNMDLDLKSSLKSSHPNDIGTYDTIEDPTEQFTLEELIDNIKLGFETVYKKKPDFTISTLKRFVVSFHFDLAFMMVILRTPYFALEGLDHDERQKFLNELSDIFKKYAILSKEHMDEQKRNKTDALEDNSSSASTEGSQDFNTDSDDSDQS